MVEIVVEILVEQVVNVLAKQRSIWSVRIGQPRSHPAPGSRAEGHRPCHQKYEAKKTEDSLHQLTGYVNVAAFNKTKSFADFCAAQLKSLARVKSKQDFGNHGKRWCEQTQKIKRNHSSETAHEIWWTLWLLGNETVVLSVQQAGLAPVQGSFHKHRVKRMPHGVSQPLSSRGYTTEKKAYFCILFLCMASSYNCKNMILQKGSKRLVLFQQVKDQGCLLPESHENPAKPACSHSDIALFLCEEKAYFQQSPNDEVRTVTILAT